jgi:hypothetical protein
VVELERRAKRDSEQVYRPTVNLVEPLRRSDGDNRADDAVTVQTIAPTPRAVRSRDRVQGMKP